MKMRTYVCRRIKLYDYLCKQGFRPYKIGADKDDPQRNVWLYDETEDLKSAVTQYYKKVN